MPQYGPILFPKSSAIFLRICNARINSEFVHVRELKQICADALKAEGGHYIYRHTEAERV
jgi:hypothetical protein